MGRVILAVTGSIAAYKSPALAGELVRRGHEVRVVLTAGGSRFVTPLALQAMTGNPVGSDLWESEIAGSGIGHIELARWGDLLTVAPASANALARLALGLADDLLGATALSWHGPTVLAPAMETHMYSHPAIEGHIATLRSRGAIVVGPESGRLASGAVGTGRMAEPVVIADAIEQLLTVERPLAGVRVLVTAGPTHEAIDPVRYLGNHSSGKMGYAVAAEAARRGASVTLVSGPTALPAPPGVQLVSIVSARDLLAAVLERVSEVDVAVMAAAVADFTAEEEAPEKLSRSSGLTLRLRPTEDVAAAAAQRAPGVLHVGFALESSDLEARAAEKLRRKSQYLVVANRISAEHNPFGADLNQVSFVSSDRVERLPLLAKDQVAARLWDRLQGEIQARRVAAH